jgi:hypothetical protein
MNLLLNTTIGELYGLESYRRISDADNFGDIDHVISVAQDELINVCGQDLTYTLTESIAPFNTDLDHEVIFNNLILELKASHLDTIRRCLYLMILKKHSDIAKSFSSIINTRKRNMDALYNIYGDKIDQWVKKFRWQRNWMGQVKFQKSMEGGWPPLVLASVIQMPYAHNQCVSPPKKMMVRQFYNHDGSEVVAISEHVDFTDILIEDGWAASVLSKTECESERITEWINRGNGYDSSGIIYVVAGKLRHKHPQANHGVTYVRREHNVYILDSNEEDGFPMPIGQWEYRYRIVSVDMIYTGQKRGSSGGGTNIIRPQANISRSKVHSTVHTPRHTASSKPMINTIMIEHQSPPRLHLPHHLDHHDDTHVEMDPRDTEGYDMDNDKALLALQIMYLSSVLKDGYGSLESGDLLPTHRIDDDDESDDNNDDTFGGRISHGDNLLSSIALLCSTVFLSVLGRSFILKASYIRFTFIYDRIYRLV